MIEVMEFTIQRCVSQGGVYMWCPGVRGGSVVLWFTRVSHVLRVNFRTTRKGGPGSLVMRYYGNGRLYIYIHCHIYKRLFIIKSLN